jgi:hypothetical protein
MKYVVEFENDADFETLCEDVDIGMHILDITVEEYWYLMDAVEKIHGKETVRMFEMLFLDVTQHLHAAHTFLESLKIHSAKDLKTENA